MFWLRRIKLKQWLQRLLQDSISYNELIDLLHFCRSLAESYLKHFQPSIVRICEKRGESLYDLAHDCIASLFGRDEQNKFYHFENFVNSLYQSLDETHEVQLFLAFKSFVLKVVTVELSKKYAELDPQGARIRRNIIDHIKRSSYWELIEDFRGCVMQPATCDPLNQLPAYPLEQLKQELLARSKGDASIPELLKVLAEILVGQEQYRRSVPLFEVVQIFRFFYHVFNEPVSPPISHPSEISRLNINNLKTEIKATIKEKIITTYYLKGRITDVEARALFDAICDRIEDWCENVNCKLPLYEYLRKYLPISKSDYEEKWRTKLEYLSNIAKDKLALSHTIDL